MADALKEAKNIYGTQLLLSDDPPKVPQGKPSVQQIGSQRTCLACDKPGHYVRDCRLLKDFRKKQEWEKRRPTQNSATRGKSLGGGHKTRRGEPLPRKKGKVKRWAEIAKMHTEEEDTYEEPKGGSNEEVAEIQGSDEESDQEDQEQGSA